MILRYKRPQTQKPTPSNWVWGFYLSSISSILEKYIFPEVNWQWRRKETWVGWNRVHRSSAQRDQLSLEFGWSPFPDLAPLENTSVIHTDHISRSWWKRWITYKSLTKDCPEIKIQPTSSKGKYLHNWVLLRLIFDICTVQQWAANWKFDNPLLWPQLRW